MRADQLLVERGLAATRSQAQRLIAAGLRWHDGARLAAGGQERRRPAGSRAARAAGRCRDALCLARRLEARGRARCGRSRSARLALPRRGPVHRRLHRLPAAAGRVAGGRRGCRARPVARAAAARCARGGPREGQCARTGCGGAGSGRCRGGLRPGRRRPVVHLAHAGAARTRTAAACARPAADAGQAAVRAAAGPAGQGRHRARRGAVSAGRAAHPRRLHPGRAGGAAPGSTVPSAGGDGNREFFVLANKEEPR